MDAVLPPFVVLIKDLGTGIVVDEHHVLTCAHVVLDNRQSLRPLEVRSEVNGAAIGAGWELAKLRYRTVPPNNELDFALLRSEKRLELEPATLLYDLGRNSNADKLLARFCHCGWAHAERLDFKYPSVPTHAGVDQTAQWLGDSEEGRSGSPLLWPAKTLEYCFGQLFLGGSGVTCSKANLMRPILEFLGRDPTTGEEDLRHWKNEDPRGGTFACGPDGDGNPPNLRLVAAGDVAWRPFRRAYVPFISVTYALIVAASLQSLVPQEVDATAAARLVVAAVPASCAMASLCLAVGWVLDLRARWAGASRLIEAAIALSVVGLGFALCGTAFWGRLELLASTTLFVGSCILVLLRAEYRYQRQQSNSHAPTPAPN